MKTKTPNDLTKTISSRDVRVDLQVLGDEEDINMSVDCGWTLRFKDQALEKRFQWYHEEISFYSSRWAVTGTLIALLVMHIGVIVSKLKMINGESSQHWTMVSLTLALNIISLVGWCLFNFFTRHQTSFKGYFQIVLFIFSIAVILIIAGQPNPVANNTVLYTTHQLTQLLLYLLMALSSIATLWNVQLLVFMVNVGMTIIAIICWMNSSSVYITDYWHLLVLFLMSIGMLVHGVYRTEQNIRNKFLRLRHLLFENYKLTRQNTFMQRQLSCHVNAIGSSPILDAGSMSSMGESWMEHVLKVLNRLKEQLHGQDTMIREVEFVMHTLTTEHDLFHHSKKHSVPSRSQISRSLNHDAESGWLHLLDENKPQRNQEPINGPSTVAFRRTSSGLRQNVVKQVENYMMIDLSRSGTIVLTAQQLLAQATRPDYHEELEILALVHCCSYPLTTLFLITLESHNLFIHLPIRLETCTAFSLEIETRYQATNPYHNAIHGAFVVWDINGFLWRLLAEYTPLQALSVLIAGAVHDVNHPGLSNTYLIATNSPLAIKYSDDSVLERMHLAEAFQVCAKPGCNLFEGLGKEEKTQSRQLIITMILATDLAGHLKHVNKLKSKRYGKNTTLKTDDLVFQTIIMMADVGHAAKRFTSHLEWSKLITEEFFRQGDKEKAFVMPVSPLCDRIASAGKFDKGQIGFLEFVVLPLYSAAKDVLPMKMDGLLEQIHDNTMIWRLRADQAEQGEEPNIISIPKSEQLSQSKIFPIIDNGETNEKENINQEEITVE